MYLKKVIVEGFKSIGIRKEIDFLNAINIIMGVNGSGKSNVFECIEWVLGGKSAKQLRASNMEDVIFDGGKSGSASNFAEATLVFDNSDRDVELDMDEISITRRLTRGKGNDYFINNEPAKLKDIKKIFENKGIGKNNYAITGQSKITDFIMMNGEQTRHVIEEAAGISGFRIKKEEILASILNYDRDIERIDAVIYEMERSLKPLKKQIKNAEIYREVKLELDQKKLFAYTKKLEECTVKIGEILDKKNDLLEKRDELVLEKQNIENFLDEYTDKYSNFNKDISILESKKTEIEEELSNKSKDTVMLENHKSNIAEKIESMSSNLSKLEASVNGEGLEANELFKGMTDLDKEIVELNKELDLLLDTINAKQSLIKNTLDEIISLENKKSELETNFKLEQNKIESNSNSIPQLEKDISLSKERLDELKIKKESIESSIEKNNLKLSTLSENYKELVEIDKNMKSLEGILSSSKKGNARKNKILDIKNLIGNVEGFNDVLFNIISYDDKYSVAMESLFGGTLFNFVVDNTEAANRCISILKKNKIPPEKFIVLDKIKSKNKEKISLKNVVNTTDILECDKKYLPLISEYFSNNFIGEDSKISEEAWNECKQKYRVVTLDGTLYAANIIKGGYVQKNLAQAQKEFNELEKKKENLLTVNDEHYSNMFELKGQINATNAQLNADNKLLNEATLSLSKEEYTLSKLSSKINSFKDAEDSFNKNSKDILSEIELLSNSILDKNEQSNSLNSEMTELLGKKEELTLKINSSKTLLEEHEKNYYIFKNNSAERIESIKSDLDILNSQFEDIESRYTSALAEENALSDKLSSITFNISEKRNALESMISDKDIKSSRLNELVEDTGKIDNDCVKLDFEIEKINEKENKYREQLSDIPDEIELVEFSDSISSLLKDISSLEKKIKSLGFINSDAIEEYEELNERYTKLTTNKKDLEDCKSKLLNVLQDIQDNMLSKYTECFEVIKKDFSEIFKRLFAGGAGELIMENPESPLDSGVIIKATPPGKKNKPLSLLSGGEKSLAAVSFIFALLKYSPSPVVIFDEIDAALDEINVSLIADYISENKNVQYIIVSHRKPMMKAADVIYTAMMTNGITNLISTRVNSTTA